MTDSTQRQPETAPETPELELSAAGIRVAAAPAPAQAAILTPDALAFLADLHRRFERTRQARLADRRARQARFDARELPDFRADTATIRAGEWRVGPIPVALADRRVEITGPADPKMTINALNSGANCFMADFEDSLSPTWTNLIAGQQALREAVAGTLEFTAENGKRYVLKPEAERAVLMVRPRGWHLDEKNVLVDDAPISASLFDLGLFAFHNAAVLHAKDRGPYFYLPKMECMEEAALWESVLSHIETVLGLPHATMKVTVLIETLPAAFEMDEILHALRERIVGLNCGRWDYIFSYLKKFRRHRDRVLPERGQVTMMQPFLKSYCELLIRTCHHRGAHAMGGMAAQIPSHDLVANEAAFAKVRADKQREVAMGFDGAWVAHPGMIGLVREVFDAHMPTPNQQHVKRDDVDVTAADLIRPSVGSISRVGFENNVEVCVRYLAAWLDGLGCVPIHGLMEDAATAEIARAQLWQWLHASASGTDPLHLDDGTTVDFTLFDRVMLALPSQLAAQGALPGAARIPEAIALLDQLTDAQILAPFLTVPAYQRLS